MPPCALAPGASAGAWTLTSGPAGARVTAEFGSLDEAAVAAAGRTEEVVLFVPLEWVMLQRMQLPAATADERLEMAQLQLEKVLPYSIDAAVTGLNVIRDADGTSDVAVVVAPVDRLLEGALPLANRSRWPSKVFLNLSRACPAEVREENSLLAIEEHGRVVVGICERGVVSFAQPLGGNSADAIRSEIGPILMGAELASAPTTMQTVRIDSRRRDLESVLAAELGAPVEWVDLDQSSPSPPSADLQPPQWKHERERAGRVDRVKHGVMLAAAVYVGLLVLGALAVVFLKMRVSSLDRTIAATAPRVAEIQASMKRWNALAPALDRRLYLIEVLHNICESIPSTDLRITSYDQSPREILVQGEAPSAALATDLNERIKARPELAGLRFSAEPPQILANGRARFRISISFG
ncbi:hypothetical protein AYO41_04600 [Verrucomicrobia bacterium SCGC AG-212-E04]|nr:hypothetical protein AYO41_04600 [Verrucomicrobia bacterium SCGC AG-212-E04]